MKIIASQVDFLEKICQAVASVHVLSLTCWKQTVSLEG